jgi:hypothetical protein
LAGTGPSSRFPREGFRKWEAFSNKEKMKI